MTSVTEDFLTTYGPWNLESFVRTFENENASFVVVQTRSPERNDESRIEIGLNVDHLWQAILPRFSGAHGHRLSWGDLVFLVRGEDLARIAAVLENVAKPLSAACTIWFATAAASRQVEDRMKQVDELSWRLAKVEYLNEYPVAWCGRDGRIVHRPG